MLYTSDLSRAIVVPTSLSVVEANLSVICGCLIVARPFLRRHLPFLLGINSERVGQPWPQVVYDEQQLAVLKIPFECRQKTSAGFGGINSSAGWVWAGSSTNTRDGTVIVDVEQRAEMSRPRNWPLRNNMLPRSGNQGNIV